MRRPRPLLKKTSIYLSEREIARLACLAEQEGRSQAEIAREAIAAYTPSDGEIGSSA